MRETKETGTETKEKDGDRERRQSTHITQITDADSKTLILSTVVETTLSRPFPTTNIALKMVWEAPQKLLKKRQTFPSGTSDTHDFVT